MDMAVGFVAASVFAGRHRADLIAESDGRRKPTQPPLILKDGLRIFYRRGIPEYKNVRSQRSQSLLVLW